MQPYQEASEEIKRQQSEPGRIARNIGSTALALTGSGALISKVAPFLSSYLPQNLAIAGLSKISPKMGKFINNAMEAGYSFDAVKEFIGDKLEQSKPQEKEQPKENRNIIQQYSPELFQFMQQEIQKGASPQEVAAVAKLNIQGKNFKNIIKKIEEDHKADFSAITESIFGGGQKAQAQPQPQGQAPQAQPGQGQAALMAILQKIQQSRGG